MDLVILFFEFFKTGLFAIGGGLATLPFLRHMCEKYDWFTEDMLSHMIAVSESTPGPLGINMATFTGFQHSGLLGAIVVTLGLITPSIIVIIIVSRILDKFRHSVYVERAFSTLRPTVTGLIAAAGFSVVYPVILKNGLKFDSNILNIINVKNLIFFIILLFLTNKYKKHPIFYIALSAAVGIIFAF